MNTFMEGQKELNCVSVELQKEWYWVKSVVLCNV